MDCIGGSTFTHAASRSSTSVRASGVASASAGSVVRTITKEDDESIGSALGFRLSALGSQLSASSTFGWSERCPPLSLYPRPCLLGRAVQQSARSLRSMGAGRGRRDRLSPRQGWNRKTVKMVRHKYGLIVLHVYIY